MPCPIHHGHKLITVPKHHLNLNTCYHQCPHKLALKSLSKTNFSIADSVALPSRDNHRELLVLQQTAKSYAHSDQNRLMSAAFLQCIAGVILVVDTD